MDALVRDLLAYTQALKMSEAEVPLTSADDALDNALVNLQPAIDESGATI